MIKSEQKSIIPILSVLALIQFAHILDYIIIMPLGDTLMQTFFLNPGQFSAVLSAYSIASFLVGISATLFIDLFNKKKLLLIVFSGFVLSTFFCALVNTYHELLAARLFTGLFGGTLSALVFSLVGDLIPYAKRGRSMGVVMSAFSFASVVGIPLSMYLVEKFRWNAPFFFLGCFSLLIMASIFFVIPSSPSVSRENGLNPLSGLSNLFRHRNQQLALSFMLLLVLGQFTVITFMIPYLQRNVGFDAAAVSLVYAIGGSLTLFSNPFAGRLADKYGRKRVFTFYALTSFIPFFVITHLPPVPVYLGLMCTGAFFVFVGGRFVPAQTIMTSVVRPENRGSFMSLTSSVQSLGLALSALISGWIVQEGEDGLFQHYNVVGYAAMGFTILALLTLPKLKESELDA